MRRFGTVLMIVGVNLVVASIGFGIYIAALRCAIAAVETACVQGVVGMYLGLMTTLPGALLWFVIFSASASSSEANAYEKPATTETGV